MIAKITRGNRAGDIGAYLHGPGKANEHVYTDMAGKAHQGGQVIASNVMAEGQTEPGRWAARLRAAQSQRPEITGAIWQASLRNTRADRQLSNDEWGQIAQEFAEGMGYADHPWVAVRHGNDHIHVVVSRVSDEGTVWHGRNDRRQAQTIAANLEKAHGLEAAPRRKVQRKRGAVEMRGVQRAKVNERAHQEGMKAVEEQRRGRRPAVQREFNANPAPQTAPAALRQPPAAPVPKPAAAGQGLAAPEMSEELRKIRDRQRRAFTGNAAERIAKQQGKPVPKRPGTPGVQVPKPQRGRDEGLGR